MEGGAEDDDDGGGVTNSIEVTKADGSDAVNINIRRSDGTNFSVQVRLASSVESFKSLLAQRCDIPAEQQRLVFKGRILTDDRVLNDYGLREDNTVHLFGGFQPATSNYTSNTVEVGTVVQSGDSSHLTPDKIRFAEFEQIQQRLFQNPNILPETMYRLMNNSDSMWFRIANTPQLVDVFDNDPMFGCIIEDSDTFRLRAEAVIFFEVIREMVRYVDRTGGAPTCPGGLAIPGLDLDGMLRSNSTPDFLTIQPMQNPIMLATLAFLALQISVAPFRRQLTDMVVRSPSFMFYLKSLEATQQLMALLQSFVYQGGQQQQSSSGADQTGGGTGGGGDGYEKLGLETVMNMYSELTPNNPPNNVGPRELYARQLAQLEELGFEDMHLNIEALQATAGNLSAALDFLIALPPAE